MQNGSHKDLIRRVTDAMNGRDFDALAGLVDPDFERHSPATPDIRVRSLEDFIAFLRMDAAACPDNRVSIETLIEEGDRVAFWARYRGTQTGPFGPFPPKGRSVDVEFSGYFEIEDDRVRRLRVVWDNVDFLTQLGHLDLSAS